MQVDKMASKKLGMGEGNNEDDSNRSNSSNGAPCLSSRKQMKEDTDFSPLPLDVLEIISQKILSFDDLFNFSAVRTEWRAVQKVYWRNFLESHSPLIVQTTSFAKRSYSFYSIPERRTYSSKVSYFWGLYYSGSSSGYLIMAGENNTLQLMNPFTRKQKNIDTSVLGKDLTSFACRVLLAFAKGSDEFVIVASCKCFYGLYVYQSRNSSWETYSKMGYPWEAVDFVVFNNAIYVITDKAEIGVLNLNTASVKFHKLKNTPNVASHNTKLLSCDGKLLVVCFVPQKTLKVYRIEWETMRYVKLETLGELSLFHSPFKCYALPNPGMWGYQSNRVYSVNWETTHCKVYSGSNNELMECILLAGNQVNSRSKPYWLDWCFRNQHDEVDYSLVE